MKFSRRHVFVLILLLLPFLIFWRNFLPGQLVMTSDANLAGFIYAHRSLSQGWDAHWNPLWWLGFPGGVPPVRVEEILIWLLPPVLYAKISIPLFLAIGGLTAFALARALGFADFVALVFALGWEMTGSSLTDIPGGHHSRQLMFGVLPLMYLGLWHASKSRPVCGVILAAAAVATMIGALADSGAILALSGICFFIWLSRRRLRSLRFWGQSLLGTVLTIVLCAQVVFLFLPSVTVGLRSDDIPAAAAQDDGRGWEWHSQWSFAPEEIVELFAPGFFGWQTGDPDSAYWGRVGGSAQWHQTRQGFRNFRLDNPTTGTAVTALAAVGVLACWRRRRVTVGPAENDLTGLGRLFSVIGALALLISFGKYLPGYRLAHDLGLLNLWRNPNKFFFVTGICLVFLAGVGAQALYDALVNRRAEDTRRWVLGAAKFCWGVAAALVVGALLVLVFREDLAIHFMEMEWSREEIAGIFGGMFASLLRGAFFWACWGGLLWAGWKWSSQRRLVAVGAVWAGLLIVEMWFVASHYISFFNYHQMLAPNPILARVIEDQKKDVFRLKMIVTDSLLNSFFFFQIPHYDIQSFDIPAISRMPADYERYFNEMATDPLLMWELGNVRYLLAQTPVADQLARQADAGRLEWVADYAISPAGAGYVGGEVPQGAPGSAYRLLRLKKSMPRTLVVSEVRVAQNVDELFSLMKSGKVDLHRTLLVLASSGVGASGKPAAKADAKIREYGDTRIIVDVESDQPAFLLLNDRYDPGWSATVNGKPARIFRANFIVRGVELPAGRSEVVFTYSQDRGLLIFTGCAWAVTLVGGALFCLFFRKRTG
jgi:membrane protein YfhO